MMKICFITMGDLFLVPYIKNYQRVLEKNECHLIVWNRSTDKTVDSRFSKIYSFQQKVEKVDGKLNKISGYWGFRKFANKILKENCYDRVVLLQVQPAILLSRILQKKYNDKYIIEIRDYTAENNSMFRKIEFPILTHAGMRIISSPGFRQFLPDLTYHICHNLNSFENVKLKPIGKPIVITNIGLIRFNQQNIRFIKKFQGDNRFKLRFIGRGSSELKRLVKLEDLDMTNIEFIDQFVPDETQKFIEETDLIFNLYGNNTPLLDYALSNKLYYAAQFRKIILTCSNTDMAKYSSELYKFGYIFDFENSCEPNQLISFINDLDENELEKSCQKFMMDVLEETKKTITEIEKFLGVGV